MGKNSRKSRGGSNRKHSRRGFQSLGDRRGGGTWPTNRRGGGGGGSYGNGLPRTPSVEDSGVRSGDKWSPSTKRNNAHVPFDAQPVKTAPRFRGQIRSSSGERRLGLVSRPARDTAIANDGDDSAIDSLSGSRPPDTVSSFFTKHTARRRIDFHAATASSTQFSPFLLSPQDSSAKGRVVTDADTKNVDTTELKKPESKQKISEASTGASAAAADDGAGNMHHNKHDAQIKRAEEIVGLPEKGLYEEAQVRKNLAWKSKVPRGRGLYNVGSTCFLNATLQCLAHLPPLAQHFLETDYSKAPLPRSVDSSSRKRQWNQRSDLLAIVEGIIKQVLRRDTRVNPRADAFKPTELLRNLKLVGPQYRHYIEEDAHEFLRQLLESMAGCCLARSKSCKRRKCDSCNGCKSGDTRLDETAAINRIFGGYLRSRLKCSCCGHHSDKYESFLDLSIELPGGVRSVEGALEAFTSVEHLTGSNRWHCEICKKLVDAEKRLSVFKAPNALVVHLKRFAVYGRGLVAKMKSRVNFGESLAVKVTGPEERAVYDLTGVVQHSGGGRRQGHYVAFVKTSAGKWCLADDSNVMEVSKEAVKSSQAYVLFYTRRRHVPKGPSSPLGGHTCPDGGTAGADAASARTVAPEVRRRGGGSSVAAASACNGVIGVGGVGGGGGEKGKPVASQRKLNDRCGKVKDVLLQPGGSGSSNARLSPGAGGMSGFLEGMASKRAPKSDVRSGGGVEANATEGVLSCRGAGKHARATGCAVGPGSAEAELARSGVDKNKGEKREMVGAVENGSGKRMEAFSPRGRAGAWGELLVGMSPGGSVTATVGETEATPDGGDGSSGDRQGISLGCDVTGNKVGIPWRPTKRKRQELFAQQVDSWLDGEDGEDLREVDSQKELQAKLSRKQAAEESKDRSSRALSFWDRSLDMGKVKKVKNKEAATSKLGENAFQAKQEELHSKARSRRGHQEEIPGKKAADRGGNRGTIGGGFKGRGHGGGGGVMKRKGVRGWKHG